jgi:excisionase family DNA binding protein
MNEALQRPLNAKEAAEYLSIKPSYLYNLVFYGKLTAFKPGGKLLLFKIADLERYLNGKQVGGHSERAEAILKAAQKKKPRRKVKAMA